MKAALFLLAAASAGTAQGQAPAPAPPPAPNTATLANPAVVYLTKYKGTWCTGPVETVMAYPLNQCIQAVSASGVVMGAMKLSVQKSQLATVINYQPFTSATCGDPSPQPPTRWLNTVRSSGSSPVLASDIFGGAWVVPNVDQCTNGQYAAAGTSFMATLGATAPTVSAPNPANFPGMKISSYVPNCRNVAGFASPVVMYEAVMSTCFSTGQSQLFTRPSSSTGRAAGYPTLQPTSFVQAPTISSTLPSDTVMNLQSSNAVCINGLISEQYFSNAVCSTEDPTTMIGYGVSKGPYSCVSGKADMQVPGVAMYPQIYGVAASGGLYNQFYAGPYKLVTCSQGDPVPANPTQSATGWAYTAAFTGEDCTGSLEAMHEGRPTGICLYDEQTKGGVMYTCDSADGGGYTAYYYDDPGCTQASTTAGVMSGSSVSASMQYPGECQTVPALFTPAMHGHHAPNFASQMNMCDDSTGGRLPVGLGVTIIKKEFNDCTGRTQSFWSLSFGAHNVSNFGYVPGQTSNPDVYSTLSCSSDQCQFYALLLFCPLLSSSPPSSPSSLFPLPPPPPRFD